MDVPLPNKKLTSDILYNCTFINGQKGKNLEINYFYFKHHGTPEEVEKAKRELNEFHQIQQNIASDLERNLNNSLGINFLRKSFYFLELNIM